MRRGIENLLFIYFFLSALYIVFGSLYLDEVTLEPLTVTSVLAAATLFQLDGLIDRCIEVMTETTNAEVKKNNQQNQFTKNLKTFIFITECSELL